MRKHGLDLARKQTAREYIVVCYAGLFLHGSTPVAPVKNKLVTACYSVFAYDDSVYKVFEDSADIIIRIIASAN